MGDGVRGRSNSDPLKGLAEGRAEVRDSLAEDMDDGIMGNFRQKLVFGQGVNGTTQVSSRGAKAAGEEMSKRRKGDVTTIRLGLTKMVELFF